MKVAGRETIFLLYKEILNNVKVAVNHVEKFSIRCNPIIL